MRLPLGADGRGGLKSKRNLGGADGDKGDT
jgi:hypothetical protein